MSLLILHSTGAGGYAWKNHPKIHDSHFITSIPILNRVRLRDSFRTSVCRFRNLAGSWSIKRRTVLGFVFPSSEILLRLQLVFLPVVFPPRSLDCWHRITMGALRSIGKKWCLWLLSAWFLLYSFACAALKCVLHSHIQFLVIGVGLWYIGCSSGVVNILHQSWSPHAFTFIWAYFLPWPGSLVSV